jgi:glyoxylase-like metal-dependent hydrolase (beta-lactamase superfamily II)
METGMTASDGAPCHEVYAIQFAESSRTGPETFLLPDPHDGPRPIFYYVWLIREPASGAVTLVDTGFSEARAAERGRHFHRCPTAGLAALGIRPGELRRVVLTHLHYDHAGNIGLFPNAEFVLQDSEMAFATGRDMRHPLMRHPFEAEDVCETVRCNHVGRVRFVDGDAQIAPGIALVHVGGHSRGLQSVIVSTARGRMVLASDAAHFFDNILTGRPFPVVADPARNLESHERLMGLADGPAMLIPGHDPAVMALFPAVPGDPMTVDLAAEPLGPPPLAGAGPFGAP